MYSLLQSELSDNSFDVKGKWELEANITIEDEDWIQACENVHKITKSPVWKEFNWKVMMRFFRTPSVTSNFSDTNSNLCWRNCNLIGDHTHTFWDCPFLNSYWNGILSEIGTMVGRKIYRDPTHGFLAAYRGHGLEKDKTRLIQILLLVARKTITKSWLKAPPPTIVQWQENLKRVYLMEKITAQLHLTLDKFNDMWALVVKHFGWSNN